MVRKIVETGRLLALKVASYSVMHLVVAMATAYALTRDWRVAVGIGLVEPIVQTLAYALHDRVWHRLEGRRLLSNAQETAEAVSARLEVLETAGPSHAHHHGLTFGLKGMALKTATYALMHFSVAVTVAFALTGSLATALAIGIVEPLVQTLFFTLHDRFWTRREARRLARA